LGIASILASLVLPSLGSMVSQYRASTMASAMLSTLYRARGEVIHRNGTVTLCKSSDGATCSTSGGYERGWILFQDANGNAALDPGEEVIQVQQMPQSDVRLYGNSTVANYISFTGLGIPKSRTGSFQAGYINFLQGDFRPGHRTIDCHEQAR
jgi:type IV fimbrial biogenesis protein FimT